MSDAQAADAHYSVRRISADVLANVVLFAPLGFGLAAVAEHRRMTRRVSFLLILASTLGLSIGVEVLQVMIPTRTASVLDVVSNAAGPSSDTCVMFDGERQSLDGYAH